MYSGQSTNGGASDGGTIRTINPAELNSQGALANPATTTIIPDTSPRGLKRSRSPDNFGDLPTGEALGDDGDSGHSRKRGRPMKPTRVSGVPESPNQLPMSLSSQGRPPQTPQAQTATLPSQLVTPTQSSPPKTTPKSVIKALPTVRDHTTDQLGPEGDEYMPRETDEQGEKKVNNLGHLLGNREYRCRTFFVPQRGDKLFMLATECARVLGYRDSYLLFNKNRSLYKIIATQAEKEDLIQQEILPFSYRSRQIAIVTAKSMFRQFGSRVIINGRRVRDDYWEGKARKQGFTEEDLAGEKRPGAAKARDAAAAEATANLAMGHQGEIVYHSHPSQYGVGPQPQHVQSVGGMMGSLGPGPGHPSQIPTLPMITLAPEQPDIRVRDHYTSNVQRPRQEISGQPYHDRTQPGNQEGAEHKMQAQNAAEYNKQINFQRHNNHENLERQWRTPHPTDSPNMVSQSAGESHGLPSVPVSQSPRTSQSSVQQSAISQQPPQHMMSTQSYSQPPRQQNPIAQSSMRGMSQGSMRPDQMGGSGLSIGPGSIGPGGGTYGYPQPGGQMWPPSQAQQSPQHSFPAYNPHSGQQSPQNAPPQLRHSGSNPQMQPALQYPGMRGIGQGNYPAPAPSLYGGQNPQQFMQTSSAGPQPGAEGWSPQQQQTSGSGSGSWAWSGQQQQ